MKYFWHRLFLGIKSRYVKVVYIKNRICWLRITQLVKDPNTVTIQYGQTKETQPKHQPEYSPRQTYQQPQHKPKV